MNNLLATITYDHWFSLDVLGYAQLSKLFSLSLLSHVDATNAKMRKSDLTT